MQPNNYGPYPAAPTMGYGEQQPGTYAVPPQGQQQQYQQQYQQQPQQQYAAQQYAQPYPQGYSAQPPMGYGQPQMQGGGTVVIIEQGGIPGGFGNMPTACVCPQCHANIQTAVTVSPGATSWLCCIGLCFVGAWPCALLPVS
jgi:hypothetical protein